MFCSAALHCRWCTTSSSKFPAIPLYSHYQTIKRIFVGFVCCSILPLSYLGSSLRVLNKIPLVTTRRSFVYSSKLVTLHRTCVFFFFRYNPVPELMRPSPAAPKPTCEVARTFNMCLLTVAANVHEVAQICCECSFSSDNTWRLLGQVPPIDWKALGYRNAHSVCTAQGCKHR